jgi:outer membrane protein assembly factor BamD
MKLILISMVIDDHREQRTRGMRRLSFMSMRLGKRNILFILVIGCYALLYSCTNVSQTSGKTEAEVLFKQAKTYYDEEQYIMATEKLNALRSQHPYSYFATHAELMLADILYKQENYGEAASAYLAFKELHPKHEQILYVLWMLGESHFQQLPSTHDRDLSSIEDATRYYQELTKMDLQGNYSKQAKERLSYMEKLVKKKEYYAADFYYKTEVYGPASYRYWHILEKYTDEETQLDAIKKLVKSIVHLSQEKCLDFYKKLEAKPSHLLPSTFSHVREVCLKRPTEESL